MKQKYKVLLLILDGWGISSNKKVSAPDIAKTPNYNFLKDKNPNNYLITHGEQVGLPIGQMGNSEVGHMNIGSGRIVLQDLLRIDESIENGQFHKMKEFKEIISHTKNRSSNIHLVGLISDGGVHSHINHLKEIIISLKEVKENIFIHGFTDGRDVNPRSGLKFIDSIEKFCKKNGGILATIIGRYFSMDRDNRWERVKKAYDLIYNGIGKKTTSFCDELEESYRNNITDEFIEPIIKTDNNGSIIHRFNQEDIIIFFNYRSDRGRQLTSVLCEKDIIDSGKTINHLFSEFKKKSAKSISIATFLMKSNQQKFDFAIDYIGFEVKQGFVVGYGLDYNQKYRNLDSLYVLENEI